LRAYRYYRQTGDPCRTHGAKSYDGWSRRPGRHSSYITIFAGQAAEPRARDYYDAIERGTLNTRIADAQVVTAKPVVSFPQKRRP
jgi:hypothetical protein